MATVINTKITERRGAKRIWVEGSKLLREGFAPGATYSRSFVKGRVRLVVDAVGDFVVSGRRRRNSDVMLPIIDITNKEVAESFGVIENIRIVIRRGVITITAQALELVKAERFERFYKKMSAGEPLSVATIFHGGGVLDKAAHHGLKKSGISSFVSMVIEIEDKYLESSLINNPELWSEDSIIMHSPVEHTVFDEENIKAEILIAALPCTGASLSGRAKNKLGSAEEHPAAGGMFYYFLRHVEKSSPIIIQIENVREYMGTASMAAIRNVLGNLGYDLQERVFNGNDFGALEARNRMVMVAVAQGLNIDFDLNAVVPSSVKPANLSAILEDLPLDSECWKEYRYLAEKEERDIANGKGFRRQILTPEAASCGVIGKGYNKGRSTEAFIAHPTNPKLSRLLTVKEHAAVKTIPESLVDGLSVTVAHEVMGQSVIYKFFYDAYASLGLALKSAAKKYKEGVGLLFSNNQESLNFQMA